MPGRVAIPGRTVRARCARAHTVTLICDGGPERDRADRGDRAAARRAAAPRARGGRQGAASSSATPPTCARPSSRSAPAPRSSGAPTWRRSARCPTRSRPATPTPASTPSASPPTGSRSPASSRPSWSLDSASSSSASCCTTSARLPIPDAILYKPGALTDEERALMARHPVIGSEIVRGIEFLAEAADVVRSHHERWDGERLPRRPGRRGDPARGARVRGRRRARRAHHRPPLPARLARCATRAR